MSGTTRERAGRPLVIARGGASADAPENTIAAFELALAQDADGIQLDVHLSRDSQPVVIADFSVERTTSGAGLVAQHTVRELKRLDAGGWYGRAFRGQRVQTLHEVLERFGRRTRFWIELKGGVEVYEGIEERIVSTLEVYAALDRAIVQSYDSGALRRIRALNSEVRVGLLLAQPPMEPLLRQPPVADAICLRADLATERILTALREAGLPSYVWTINEKARIAHFIECGVSGIVTDRPATLRRRMTG